MVNRKISPEIKDAVDFDLQLKPYTYFELANHTPVYSVQAGSQEVLMLEWVFYAGNSFEEKNIVAATTNFLLKNGTKNRSAYEINDYFEFYGAYLNRSCYNETASVTLHCLSKHLPKLLPVVAELFTESCFPENELAIYKQNQRQRLDISLKKCDFVANRLIDEYLYGLPHPYGKYTSHEDYAALQREELVEYYNRFYTQGKCLIFAAGILPEDLQVQLDNAFGHLPFNAQRKVNEFPDPNPAVTKKYNIVNDKDGVQGAIRIARPFPNRHHPDFIKVQILNCIFGGYFGSRLMANIREDKGYTYGIYSYLQNHIHSSAWVISTEAGREVCEATIKEIYGEMQLLRNEPVSDEELLLVKNYMMGGILGELDGPFQIIGRWRNYILNGLNETFFHKSLDTIRNIKPADLQELANKYLNPEEFYELQVV